MLRKRLRSPGTRLGKLIYLYDQNHISLAGATSLTFTEDVGKRFEAYGWHTAT